MRRANTTRSGGTFPTGTVQQVWNKGRPVAGYNPYSVRADACGAPMSLSDYGNTSSPYGWEVDHIRPVAHGGSDELWNLQPLQWQNNRRKGDDYPNWTCAV